MIRRSTTPNAKEKQGILKQEDDGAETARPSWQVLVFGAALF